MNIGILSLILALCFAPVAIYGTAQEESARKRIDVQKADYKIKIELIEL